MQRLSENNPKQGTLLDALTPGDTTRQALDAHTKASELLVSNSTKAAATQAALPK
jgi:hypothetical protein